MVSQNEIEDFRARGKGINEIQGVTNKLKISIAEELIRNLFAELEKTENKKLLNTQDLSENTHNVS